MASLTKTERVRIHKVLERDRIRKQFRHEGLEVPPLLDPDVLGRGPGQGPEPVGQNPGDEESKPSAAQVARATRATYAKRIRENVPPVALVPTEVGGEYRVVGEPGTEEVSDIPEVATTTADGESHAIEIKKPRKAVLEAITDKKIAGRDVNLRGEYDKEEQAEAVEDAQESMDIPKAPKAARTSSTGKPSSEKEQIKKGVSR
jgi:hypothetical protein